jgi:hypothetical protein
MWNIIITTAARYFYRPRRPWSMERYRAALIQLQDHANCFDDCGFIN